MAMHTWIIAIDKNIKAEITISIVSIFASIFQIITTIAIDSTDKNSNL